MHSLEIGINECHVHLFSPFHWLPESGDVGGIGLIATITLFLSTLLPKSPKTVIRLLLKKKRIKNLFLENSTRIYKIWFVKNMQNFMLTCKSLISWTHCRTSSTCCSVEVATMGIPWFQTRNTGPYDWRGTSQY